jgi:hypothetical protein
MKNIEQIYDSFSLNDIYSHSEISIDKIGKETSDAINKEIQNIFVSDTTRDFFSKCQFRTTILLPKYEFTMNLYHISELDFNISHLFQSIKRAVVTRKIFKIHGSIIVHFICAPHKRYIPSSGNISSKHINGGFTDISNNEIYITRVEEYPKVLLHEILHHCKDIHGTFSKHNVLRLKTSFNIYDKTVLLPNEAVIEFWATLLVMKFRAIETKIPYQIFYETEMKHSICQSKKIMKKQGMKKWKETTNSYCYIVFKTILLANAEIFLKHYTFPYDDAFITSFLIDNKDSLDKTQYGDSKLLEDKSLRMMIFSN